MSLPSTPGSRRLLRRLLLAGLGLALVIGPWSWMRAHGSPPSNAPQVLLVITNSQSMGGTTGGAIMTGSGSLGSDRATLQNTTSPVNYTIPTGFVPPLNAGSGGSAPYSVSCQSGLICDNGPSRLNLAKYAIQQVLSSYGNEVDFGVYTYNATSLAYYTSWLGYISPNNGFSWTSTASASTVANPCYNYSSASTQVKSDCGVIAAQYGAQVGTQPYLVVSATSDSPLINTVLHDNATNALFMLDSGVASSYYYLSGANATLYSGCYGTTLYPVTTPPYFSLSNYEGGTVWSCYPYSFPSQGTLYITPSNAAYLPYSPQGMYVQRGFAGIASTVSATTGQIVVPMGTSPTSSTFTAALQPETNSTGTSEIKAVARQSAIAGLMTGALSYLQGVTKTNCQQQFVVLLTDGLPTLDLAGNKWPPLGTAAGAGYGVTASFNSDGTLASTNDQALSDALSSIRALASAGIKTYVIGLGAGVNNTVNPSAAATLQAMALAGGTSGYYPANNSSDLNAAFLAIVNQIYTASAVAAPVVPVSVSNGSSYEYLLTSVPVPTAGAVSAYAVNASGVPASTASWEAGAQMSATGRSAAMLSTASDNATISSLGSIDAAAFALSPTTCVPNVATVVSFTVNPSYTANGCSYLAGRASGAFLGAFSSQNGGAYVGPPANSTLISDSSYVSYANGLSTRTPMLLFSNDDGFLYGINASSGALLWAWTPRSTLAQLQNYSTFLTLDWMDGGFTVVDAKDSNGSWGSYVVGSLRSGAEHYSIKLNSSGTPTTVVYDNTVASGTAPGDLAPTVGSGASRQPPQIAWFNGSAYALYVVNLGSTSTLYEVNVATGSSSSAALGFLSSSSLSYNSQSSLLWVGSSAGGVWQIPISGNASNDVAAAYQVGTTVNPATSATATPVLYVGYTELAGIPYVYALNPSQITVFSAGSGGWTTVWATTQTQGYLWSGGSFASTATVNTLGSAAVVSDIPLVVGGALLVPEYVPPSSGCGAGSGYIALFDLKLGKFPSLTITYQGSTVTANVLVGSGPAFTPSVTVTTGSVALDTGSRGQLSPSAPMTTTGLQGPKVSAWRIVN